MSDGMHKVDIHCGHCMSIHVKVVDRFNGEDVVPDDYTSDTDGNGVVVQCNDCNDVTGWLIKMTGVVKAE